MHVIVKWNRSGKGFLSVVALRLRRSGCRVSLASPGTKDCDAVGGALRPECRARPAGAIDSLTCKQLLAYPQLCGQDIHGACGSYS